MNTKVIMTISAIILGSVGILATFIPEGILSYLNTDSSKLVVFLVQIIGALYFAFGMLNWMTKTSLIGGIYNRPIAVANFTHFLIAGLALFKGLISDPNLPYIIWIAGIIYLLLGISFGLILFRHPIETKLK